MIILNSVEGVGLVLNNQRKCEEAEIIHQRDLVPRETVQGVNHAHTLTIISNLDVVLMGKGSTKELRQCIDGPW